MKSLIFHLPHLWAKMVVSDFNLIFDVNVFTMSSVYKKILIKGVVQGVGFRPFVYRTAIENHISGSVINLGNMIQILAAGHAENMDSFLSDLKMKSPPLSRIDEMDIFDIDSGEDFDNFNAKSSRAEFG